MVQNVFLNSWNNLTGGAGTENWNSTWIHTRPTSWNMKKWNCFCFIINLIYIIHRPASELFSFSSVHHSEQLQCVSMSQYPEERKKKLKKVTSSVLSRLFAFALQNAFVMSDRFPGWHPISLRLIGVLHLHNLTKDAPDNRQSWTSSLKRGITEDSNPQWNRFTSPGLKIH